MQGKIRLSNTHNPFPGMCNFLQHCWGLRSPYPRILFSVDFTYDTIFKTEVWCDIPMWCSAEVSPFFDWPEICPVYLSQGKSSRRKFLRSRNFRPLTPSCVPFGTRRFNQLNKRHASLSSSPTLRLARNRLISCCLWPGIHPRLYKPLHSPLHRLYAMPPNLEPQV